MKKIQIWSIEYDKEHLVAKPIETLANAETEQQLEDLLVSSPDLLATNLTLVGRQLPTESGPLDLLGINEDGQLVVFELKRGTLTREAVAQIIDYASDLAQMSTDRLCDLIEEHSGQRGTEEIKDFEDWYSENYPNSASVLLEKPRMVLVGLGVDERALRMVNFLADSGVDIQLLTFHAFEKDCKLFLARQVESVSPSTPSIREKSTAVTKQDNLESLRANARSLDVSEFLEEVAGYFRDHLPAYQWPAKTRYSYSLTERTERGTPSLRVYISVALNFQEPNSLTIIFLQRAIDAAGSAILSFRDKFDDILEYNERYHELWLHLTPEHWSSIVADLEPVLKEMLVGWKTKEKQSLAPPLEESVSE